MNNKLVVLAALLGVAVAVPSRLVATSESDALFARFKSQYNKVYFDDHDESYRKTVFLANLEKIRAHNAGDSTFTMAMNEFGDLTWEEFHAKYTGFLGARSKYMRSQNVEDLSHVQVADSVDWVAKGAVTAVKNQGQCGSCWAFSTTGSVEGAWFLSKGQLTPLSEQQLMDCSKEEGNNSCEGGLMDYAFEYIIKNGGICSEASYPYKERDENTCKSCTKVAHISSYKDVATNENALKAAVTQQPISVAIEADQSAFQFYSGGVLTGTCGRSLDHGVLAVGYGTLNGTPYWKVKNSWGASWGMEGYVLIESGVDKCGISDAASYPIV